MGLLLATSAANIAMDVGMALGAFFFGVFAASVYFRTTLSKQQAEQTAADSIKLAAMANDAERSCMAAQNLRDLAQNVASDVGAHHTLVGDISTQLGALQNGEDLVQQGTAVMAAVNKLLAANNKLQDRLEDAERKIQVQAEEIRSQQSEARTDSLTKLANRRAFDVAMNESFDKFRLQRRPFSVLILDVDHFKSFNDAHGHQAGDDVLRSVGRTLARSVKTGDIPCRYGGEEFAVVLANTKIADARVAGERIRKSIEETSTTFGDEALKVTASIGVAEIQPNEDCNSVVRRADDAVYASKRAGRNCTHWHDGQACLSLDEQSKNVPSAEPERPLPKSMQPQPQPEATSLADRKAFADELRRRVSESQRFGAPLSIINFEICDFQRMQNEFGTAVGGLLVDSVAMFIKSTLRDMDLLAKMGDGQLAVMLPGSTSNAAKIVGQRIRTAISQCPIPLGSKHVRLSLDMGVSSASAEDDGASLLAHAAAAVAAARSAREAEECEVAVN